MEDRRTDDVVGRVVLLSELVACAGEVHAGGQVQHAGVVRQLALAANTKRNTSRSEFRSSVAGQLQAGNAWPHQMKPNTKSLCFSAMATVDVVYEPERKTHNADHQQQQKAS